MSRFPSGQTGRHEASERRLKELQALVGGALHSAYVGIPKLTILRNEAMLVVTWHPSRAFYRITWPGRFAWCRHQDFKRLDGVVAWLGPRPMARPRPEPAMVWRDEPPPSADTMQRLREAKAFDQAIIVKTPRGLPELCRECDERLHAWVDGRASDAKLCEPCNERYAAWRATEGAWLDEVDRKIEAEIEAEREKR